MKGSEFIALIESRSSLSLSPTEREEAFRLAKKYGGKELLDSWVIYQREHDCNFLRFREIFISYKEEEDENSPFREIKEMFKQKELEF